MSIRRRLLFSYATLILVVLAYLGVSAGMRAVRGRIDTQREDVLTLKNSWSRLQISLNDVVVNWRDGESFNAFTEEYAAFNQQLLDVNRENRGVFDFDSSVYTHLANLTNVWEIVGDHLDMVVTHIESPEFAPVAEIIQRRPGLQRLNLLWVELYGRGTPPDLRLAYEIETLISLVDFFPIYGDTVNHMFDVILADASETQRRVGRIEVITNALFFAIFLCTAIALSIRFAGSLSRPIIRVSDRLNRFMGRNTEIGWSEPLDEVRALARTAEHMMRHYTKLSTQAQRLARGEVAHLDGLSPLNGVVGHSMVSIAAYFEELATTTTRIRDGEYDASIVPKSEDDILAKNVNAMTRVIKEQITTLRSMFEGVDEGVIVVDQSGRVLEYNQRLLRILGIDESEPTVSAETVREILGPNIDEALRGEETNEVFRTLTGTSGQFVPVKIRSRSLEPQPSSSPKVMLLISNESWRERSKRERDRLRAHAAEAELRALRAQINPHFFFNTLNTIAYLVETNVENAVLTIEKLADLFRYTLASTRKDRVTIEEEIRQVQRYLDIEKLRYGERLVTTFIVDQALASVRIPPMLLQPLVENAVRYGQSADGTITIEVQVNRLAELVQIAVIDHGPGVEKTEDLLNGPGTGIKNVNHRLKSLHREQLRFRGVVPHGLAAEIHVPAR